MAPTIQLSRENTLALRFDLHLHKYTLQIVEYDIIIVHAIYIQSHLANFIVIGFDRNL